MDVHSWHTVSNIAMYGGGIVAAIATCIGAIGGAGVWYTGRQIADADKQAAAFSESANKQQLTGIEGTLSALVKDKEYKAKYPLGFYAFYADGSEQIRRIGKTQDVKIFWDDTRIRLTDTMIYVDTKLSAARDDKGVAATITNMGIERKGVGVIHLFTILDRTELILEIVEDRTTGIVAVFGVRRAPEIKISSSNIKHAIGEAIGEGKQAEVVRTLLEEKFELFDDNNRIIRATLNEKCEAIAKDFEGSYSITDDRVFFKKQMDSAIKDPAAEHGAPREH